MKSIVAVEALLESIGIFAILDEERGILQIGGRAYTVENAYKFYKKKLNEQKKLRNHRKGK